MTTINPANPSDWKSFDLLQSVIDALDTPIFVKDLQHRWIACNRALCELIGQPYDQIIGRSDPDYFPPAQVEVFWRVDDEVTSTGIPASIEEHITDSDGTTHTVWTRKFPIRNSDGQIGGVCGIISDITELKQRQQRLEQTEHTLRETQALMEAQSSMIEQLSVPVIQVWENILLLPLSGALDSRRAARVLENLLDAISRLGAQVVILDITGVPVVDTTVASYLVRSVQASQLLGCESILVGISPEIAQTLVGLGIDFSQIVTRATLQNGLEYALKRLDYTVNRLRGPKRAG